MSRSPSVVEDDAEAYPPKEWHINTTEEFPSYTLENVTEPLEGALLLNADKSGAVHGHARLVLDGKALLEVDTLASEILLVGGAASYRLKWQTWPRDVAIRQNGVTSAWVDVTDR
jgi:hypothetical protein